MPSNKDLIWYVAYGSNLLRDRFLCYILGGQAKGCRKKDRGCKDKTIPLKNKAVIINHEAYFASEANIWGKSAAIFVKGKACPEQGRGKGGKTFGRAYLIRKDQFKDIVLQENNVNAVNIEIDFDEAIQKSETIVQSSDELKWYSRILYLGEEDGYPMFTFTAEDDLQVLSKPSQLYLNIIKDGLRESHRLTDEQIEKYLEQVINL